MWLTWEMWGILALLLFGGELWTQSFVLLWPALGAAATGVGNGATSGNGTDGNTVAPPSATQR